MDYGLLLEKIKTYEKKYQVKIIGKSFLNRNIYAVEKIAKNEAFTAIFVAGMHAREHITCDLLCKMIDSGLFDEISDFNLAFVPMANPDGIELEINGLTSVSDENLRQKLLKINGGSQDFSMWKANAKGVDLNNNFDANFGQNSSKFAPSSQGYAGPVAVSEPETQALVRFVKNLSAFLTVSYHSKGEEIYFNFFQEGRRLGRDEKIAKQFENSTGYKIVNVENSSSGGFKDWCVQSLKIPALTIEIGSDDLVHPIGKQHLDEIFKRHKMVAKDIAFAYNEFIKFNSGDKNGV